jgi:hypothetical protein
MQLPGNPPDHFSKHPSAGDQSKPAAVVAFGVASYHKKLLSVLRKVLQQLDQDAISRVAENYHISWLEVAQGKVQPAHQDIIPLYKKR